MQLLQFVEQHGCEFVISDSLDFARIVADHEFRIYLNDFLGDQSVLHVALRVGLKVKGHGTSRCKLLVV